MKKTLVLLIKIYHIIFISNIRTCRFEPTCSQYFLDSINKHGVLKGLHLSLLRLSSCHPFTKRPIIDPV